MHEKLLQLKQEILDNLSKAMDLASLRDLEIKYLGRKGVFTEILKSIAALSDEEKKTAGALANTSKREIESRFAEVRQKLASEQENISIDITMPGKKIASGHLHPITAIQKELEELFVSMGFKVLDGPELESDFYNFTGLNIPKFHPARDMQDTFYIDTKNRNAEYDLVMRTHTSPVQVRAMQKYGAPLRCIAPGQVFRNEASDACHDHTFYQMEGLMVDENISLANLTAVMKQLMNSIFKKEMETRVRPGYFPFVEPGIEMDIKCTICEGKGCPSCKHSGWLEVLPAGMIHPNVLKSGGIDPEKYSGFAFGLGLTRLAMMKYGIDDIRYFNSGDLRFLEQF